jgi:hypothetical protein
MDLLHRSNVFIAQSRYKHRRRRKPRVKNCINETSRYKVNDIDSTFINADVQQELMYSEEFDTLQEAKRQSCSSDLTMSELYHRLLTFTISPGNFTSGCITVFFLFRLRVLL